MTEPSNDESEYPVATRPVAFDTLIRTDDAGLIAGTVTIPAGDIQMAAYRAAPLAKNAPIVLLVHEIYGVHEWIRDVARRIAHLGYFVVAPELFQRQGDARLAATADLALEIANRAPDEQVISDLDAAQAWACQNGGDGDRVGITGFCWGGRMVWLYAARQNRVDCATAWYGPVSGDTGAAKPATPLDLARQLQAPVLGLYGGKDAMIPVTGLSRMESAASFSGSHIHIYAESGHAFFGDYRKSYREADAKDAWMRFQSWMAAQLKPA